MRISDWSSDVCSSDLHAQQFRLARDFITNARARLELPQIALVLDQLDIERQLIARHHRPLEATVIDAGKIQHQTIAGAQAGFELGRAHAELQSLMRISYAVFCLKKKKT